MSRQAHSTSHAYRQAGSPSGASESAKRTGQAKKPSVAQDILMLGDLYLTLGWLAFQRLRHGPLWPWEAELGESPAPVTTLARPQEAEESAETVRRKRG